MCDDGRETSGLDQGCFRAAETSLLAGADTRELCFEAGDFVLSLPDMFGGVKSRLGLRTVQSCVQTYYE